MADKLPNPYEDEIVEPTVKISAKVCWILTAVFVAMITLPPMGRNLAAEWKPALEFFRWNSPAAQNLLANKRETDPRIQRESPNFIDHREAWEKQLDDAPFSDQPRQVAQLLLTFGREGNRQTVIGSDGWFYYRPAIDALTGYGPLKPEPDSVAKDPTRPPWSGPREAIIEFAKQLEELGVELMLVPIPVKTMIVPDGLTNSEIPLQHPDAAEFYAQLTEAEVEVVDLLERFEETRASGLYLSVDTHWTPRGMDVAADIVAKRVKAKEWFGELESKTFETKPVIVRNEGDLVDKLDLPAGRYEEYETGIQQLQAPEIRDQDSPVVLLGDSFTNIYSAEEMGWGKDGGFAETLSAKLGIAIDTIAQNGQASTGVRKTLANRPGSAFQMREEKKLVIWAIAARDLFLSETVARETNVEWKSVAFNKAERPRELPTGAIVIEGEMIERSNFPPLASVPYLSVLYASVYQISKVVEGEFNQDRVIAYHWGFKDRKMMESAGFQPGDKHTLTLVPLNDSGHLSVQRIENIDEIFHEPFFVEEAKPLSE
ncbi:MAG: hypothetical protein AAF585_12880 [Verrucomicrobiota bacterium]